MRETINDIRRRLVPVYGRGEAEAMTRLIFHHLKGWSTVDMLINEDKPLSDYMRAKIDGIVSRVEAGEPIQYVLGEAYFYGMPMAVDRSTLIPRPETEELVDMIVKRWGSGEDLRVLDIGTGSGCIAIALARNLRFAHVTATDLSADALKVAEANASKLHARISFIHSDMREYTPESGSLDIVVSNPPYIGLSERDAMDANVKDWEPASALFVSDNDPLVWYREICRIASGGLKAGGMLYLEINPLRADNLLEMVSAYGLTNACCINDIHGRQRFITAVKPSDHDD